MENKTQGIASILTLPMMLRGESLGVMRVHTGESCDLNPYHTYFVWAVAKLGALALENAGLYEKAWKDRRA